MTSQKDRERLRKLAARYAEIVNSDEMNKRREIWRLSNRLLERTVPFVIEDNGTFFNDLDPKCECTGELELEFEKYLVRTICNYELIPDNRIYTPYLPVQWMITRPTTCPSLKITRAPDASGRELGYVTNTPLADLANSLHLLERSEFKVDRDGTYSKAGLAESIFGDLLPVRIVCKHTVRAGVGMAYQAVMWMGMDNFYIAMIDQPENVHRFFDFMSTECLDFLNWLKREKLIRPNHGEFECHSGSTSYTDELPRRKIPDGGPWLPEDCWGATEAQEAAGISNEMYAEFIFPYQNRVVQDFGLVYYGCCEAVHVFWPTIKKFKNMRKMTISPWCDQKFMAEAVGKNYVLSRKPHPMQLCGKSFNPESFTAHIKETLDIAKDNFVELVFRDTCTLDGTMKDRVREACGIVRKLIGG
ncbi:MAG: hypothetical protein WCP55_11145 [Lentisphaerota bacterium]